MTQDQPQPCPNWGKTSSYPVQQNALDDFMYCPDCMQRWTKYKTAIDQPAEPRLTAEDVSARFFTNGLMRDSLTEDINAFAKQEVDNAVAARDHEWNTAKSCVEKLMYDKANQEWKDRIQKRINYLNAANLISDPDFWHKRKIIDELESLLK